MHGLVPQGPPSKAEQSKKPKALSKTSTGPIKIGIGGGAASALASGSATPAASATSAPSAAAPQHNPGKPKHISILGQDESDDDDVSGVDPT